LQKILIIFAVKAADAENFLVLRHPLLATQTFHPGGALTLRIFEEGLACEAARILMQMMSNPEFLSGLGNF
jgi:hypothetical protein